MVLSWPTKTNIGVKTSFISFQRVEERNPTATMLMNLDLYRAWIKAGSKRRVKRER